MRRLVIAGLLAPADDFHFRNAAGLALAIALLGAGLQAVEQFVRFPVRSFIVLDVAGLSSERLLSIKNLAFDLDTGSLYGMSCPNYLAPG